MFSGLNGAEQARVTFGLRDRIGQARFPRSHHRDRERPRHDAQSGTSVDAAARHRPRRESPASIAGESNRAAPDVDGARQRRRRGSGSLRSSACTPEHSRRSPVTGRATTTSRTGSSSFLWRRTSCGSGGRALLEAPVRPSTAGLALVAASLLVFIAGRFGAELYLTRVSLLGVLAGTVLALGGWQRLRIAAFPLAFLLLMIPLPSIVFNQITFPLQGIASRAGEAVIAAAGVPVLREGNILHVPGPRARSGRSVLGHPFVDVPADARDRARVLHRAPDRRPHRHRPGGRSDCDRRQRGARRRAPGSRPTGSVRRPPKGSFTRSRAGSYSSWRSPACWPCNG